MGHTRVQAGRHRWSEVAAAGAPAYGKARWRVERAMPPGTQAWLAPTGRDGWQAGLRLAF